jgi:NAD+ diphosphatase
MSPADDWSGRLGYVDDGLDRRSYLRDDPAFLAAETADPAARSCLFAGEAPILRRNSPVEAFMPLVAADGLGASGERIYLGHTASGPRFAASAPATLAEGLRGRSDLMVADLRQLAFDGGVDRAALGLLGVAKSMLSWHARHRFCANCGTMTVVVCGGWKRVCPACAAEHFPRVDPVAIMLVGAGADCLLGRQARFAPGMWSCLAGFIEPGETIEAAVRREVQEEAGVAVGAVRYLGAQPWPFPSSLMIGCRAEALARDIVVDRLELEDARWFSRAEARAMLDRTHPDGLMTPPPPAIAHHLIRAFVDEA